MKVVRIYTGDDNQSHFEEIDLPFAPDGPGELTPPLATNLVFSRRAPGGVQDWHCAPRRQYVISLSGLTEIEIGDGTKRQFRAGDILLAEDLTGQGHITRWLGDEPRTSIWVPLGDQQP
jgi:hypothetical protein